MDKSDINLIKEKEKKELELREIARSLGFSREFKIYFSEIISFHKENGHFRIPVRMRTKDNLPIGRFMMKLRFSFNRWKISKGKYEKKHGVITQIHEDRFHNSDNEMFEELDKLDFHNSLIRTKTDWDRGYEYLEKYYKEFGHSYVKPGITYGDRNYKLGTWATYQRVQRKKDNLDDEKVDRLNKLNFLWTVDLTEILSCTDTSDSRTIDTKLNLKKLFNKNSNESKYKQKVKLINTKRKELHDINLDLISLQKEKKSKELRLEGFSGLLKDVNQREQSIKEEIIKETELNPQSSLSMAEFKYKLDEAHKETKELSDSIHKQEAILKDEITQLVKDIEKKSKIKETTLTNLIVLNQTTHELVK